MHTKKYFHRFGLPAALGLAALLSACGGGGDAAPAQGTLQVKLTDAPACGFDNVYVTVSKVRVNQSSSAGDNDSSWQDIVLDSPRKIDLLTLTNGLTTDLGIKTLPAGHYTQVRLVLDKNVFATTANSVVVAGVTKPLSTPSGQTSGLKVNIKDNGFDVAANSTVALMLDFDACKSIVNEGNGNYSLKPVITAFPVAASSTSVTGITGNVSTGLTSPVVTAQQNGVVVKATVPNSDGSFNLSPLPDSTTSYVVVLTADGRTTAAITGVPVTTGQKTAIGTTIAPTMSTMRTISGTATPVEAQALVRATQNYSSGPKIEVGFVNANPTSGAYSFSVPTDAPLLGSYSTSAITLAPDVSATAGKYTVEASATGYSAQSSSADVSSADATNVNLVLPKTP
jgi:hypothetical protein